MGRRGNAGFSLLETMVAMGVIAIVVAALYGLPGFFSSQQARVTSIVSKDRLFKSFAQSFIDIAGQADVAIRFEYLPINVSCAGGGPCVQQLGADNSLSQATVPEATTLQFFNDEIGTVTPTFLFNPVDPANSSTGWFSLSLPRLTLQSATLNKENYATWPLTSPASPTFPLLKRSSVIGDYFSVAPQFVGSATSSNWIIAQGNRAGSAVAQIQGRPMVIYNAGDFSQYMVRRLATAYDCTTSNHSVQAACLTAAQSLVPTFTTTGATDPFYVSGNYYAFELLPYSVSELANFLPSGMAGTSAWAGGQDAHLSLFPTQQLSLTWVGSNNPDPTDFALPTVSKMAHVYHGWPPSQQGSLTLMPVDLIRYFLVNDLDSKGNLFRMHMQMETLGTGKQVTALDEIALGSSIIFSRRLGTSEVGVFQMQ